MSDNVLLKRFQELANAFDSEIMFVSSDNVISECWACQEVVKLGTKVVPLLINDMVNNRRPWFHALSKITKTNPIKTEHRGVTDKMIEDWNNWFKENYHESKCVN